MALPGLWFSPSMTERSQNEPETRSLRLKALDSALPLPWLCHWSTHLTDLSLSVLICKVGIMLTINSLTNYLLGILLSKVLLLQLLTKCWARGPGEANRRDPWPPRFNNFWSQSGGNSETLKSPSDLLLNLPALSLRDHCLLTLKSLAGLELGQEVWFSSATSSDLVGRFRNDGIT